MMPRCLCRRALQLLLTVTLCVYVTRAAEPEQAWDTAKNRGTAVPQMKEAAEHDIDDAGPVDEGTRAYHAALQALSPLYSSDEAEMLASQQSISFLRSFISRRAGPVDFMLRILSNLHIPGLAGSRSAPKGEIRGRGAKVLDLLSYAVEQGNMDALAMLGEVSMFPPTSIPMNLTRAFEAYTTHATLTGSPFSQSLLGFFYATGYGGVVEVDQAKALLYYTFAAVGGDQTAEMALGYRHWAGIGVPEDCMTALGWYESAAERAMAQFLSGPPGGRTLLLYPTRLSDLIGGVYGPGSSVASTGWNANRAAVRAGQARAAGETWQDILEFYQYHTDQGELEYTLRLGKIYYHGTLYIPSAGSSAGGDAVGAVRQDYRRAAQYFVRIARHMWPRDSLKAPLANLRELDERSTILVAQACGYLGRLYMRGEGVRQDAKIANMWFERGAEYGDRECHNGLGIIHKEGLLGSKDDAKAIHYFAGASGADLAEAQVQLGRYHLLNGDSVSATQFFDIALRHGSPFEAYYYLAHIHASMARAVSLGTTSSGSCAVALSWFKIVAERGAWDNDWMGEAEKRWNTGHEQDRKIAMLYWAVAAEAGHEIAQNNIAYLLDKGEDYGMTNHTSSSALLYWTRSAAQNNIDALVKVGDYYYHGLGIADALIPEHLEKAAGYYQSAVESQLSALAMWNLGWMYENGLGIPQDFHLAKRYYDLAMETNPGGYLPVTLSLIKLYARSIWYTISGGKNHGLSLWDLRDATDEHWYLGKSKEDAKKARRNSIDGGIGERVGEDAVQWARDRRDRDEQGDFGPEDHLFSGEGEDGESVEFVETLLLLILCGLLAWLIYVRTQWATRRAVEERRRRDAAGQPDGQAPNHRNAVGRGNAGLRDVFL
ncbi:HCP-like protein [Dacryopinax primogenitus]|uniref:HCP-like protein n=1 Tax=Dacryopinax primogenitus (strain DJM 731) TaxID=1858805 RepID=M5FSI2_DACPD|nr:HCP-like protein [Dacryopinax primogenitus]EJT98843.1 HCP-like protein [Dacryopinax primogenitus]